MSFDASPEEMYPEYFPEREPPSGPPDRQPYQPDWSHGWYFRVDHKTYGVCRSEVEAWKAYRLVHDEVYTDEEEDE